MIPMFKDAINDMDKASDVEIRGILGELKRFEWFLRMELMSRADRDAAWLLQNGISLDDD